MRKKKAAVIKEIKGGVVNYQDANMHGVIVSNKFYDLAYKDPTVNKLPGLIKDFQSEEDNLSKKIEKLKKEKENLDKNRHNAREEELKFENLENKRLFDDRKNTLKWTNFYAGIAGATIENGKQLISFGKDVAGSAFTFLGFAGNGVILRVILIIVALALIIGLGLASMYSPQFNDAKNRINAKMNELVYPDFDNYLHGPNPFKGLNDMMQSLQDRIPGNLKYKYNAFVNSLSYITTGKNQYENFLVDREMITSGRCDNIIHMNFNNLDRFQNDKTYCALQPKPIILYFNSNLYPSADYNQLDQTLREDLKYPDIYNIPINSDPKSGRYDIDINGSYYSYGDIELKTPKYNYLPKLFKKDKNKIVFNDNPVSSFNLLSSVIGIYGVSLLNKKHKDPIMVINDFNEFNTSIRYKTSLYYKDDKSYQCYDKTNNLIPFKFDKPNTTYYDIEMLLDQSGNNRHFVWKDNDNKYRPMLIKDENHNFAIKFESRNILYQNIPIAFPKMFIKSTIIVDNGLSTSAKLKNKKIEFDNYNKEIDNIQKTINDLDINNLDDLQTENTKLETATTNRNNAKAELDKSGSYRAFNKIDSFMDFLSTNTTSAVKLQLEDSNSKYTVKIDSIFNDIANPINNDYQNIQYNINDKNTIMTNLDNGRIETIGCILDPRNKITKDLDNHGNKLSDQIVAHNFVGYLYDLHIYDRTKM